MNGTGRMERSGASGEWKVGLECGHQIVVPWGSASPAVLAGILEHRHECDSEPPMLTGPAWWAAPLAARPIPAFR